MSHSSTSEPSNNSAMRRKSSNSTFPEASSSDDNSIRDRTTRIINTKSNIKRPLINNRCLDFISSRPPPSPNDNQRIRTSSTGLKTRIPMPRMNSRSSIANSSRSAQSRNELNGTTFQASVPTNRPKKSLSFQVFYSDKDSIASLTESELPRPARMYANNQAYYSLQRPPYSSKCNQSYYNEMDPDTLRPKNCFIRRSAKPSMDNQRRREYSLKFMIESISNVTSKKRYHCELKLNNRTYARTSSRLSEKGEATWNEIYELCNLSPVTSVTINLYKEMIEGKGDKKKNVRHKMAFVTMPIEELYERNEVKKRLPMQKCPDESLNQTYGTSFCVPSEQRHNGSGSKSKSRPYLSDSSDSDLARGEYHSSSLPRDNCSGSTRSSLMRYLRSRKESDHPTVSISAKYQCIEILPLTSYHDLSEFMLHNYQGLVQYLDETLSGRRLEEVASSMVSIHELAGNAPKFITNSISSKLELINNSSAVALRANSIGSKAIESYMKLVGMDYLKDILGDFALKILLYPSSLEVDPSRLNDRSFLKLTQVQLCSMVHSLWQTISSSIQIFPIELRRVFVALRRSIEQKHSPEFADQILSSCLFLRLICPAILNPYLYQMIQEYPQDPRIIRNFTLISKSLQTLANQTGPENEGPSLKEPFMIPIHESLSKERNKMISFLREISTESPSARGHLQDTSKWHDYIDIGFELAVSHLYLAEVLISSQTEQNLSPELRLLIPILNNISALLCASSDQSSTKGIAEILSKSCKLLVDNTKEVNATGTYQPNNARQRGPTQTMTNRSLGNNTTRKSSVPLELDKYWQEKNDSKKSTMRYTMNIAELNDMWKNLVERAEEHINGTEQPPRCDIDFDPDFQMEYQFCFNATDDLLPMTVEVGSLPSSGQTPTSQSLLPLDSSINGDSQSIDNTSPIIHYPPPPPIDTLPPNNVLQTQKLSPTKSIRMGTKAVQTTQIKKAPNDLDTMRRLVSEAELKYLQAKKEMEIKEEENRILRELLRSQSNKCPSDGVN